MTGFIDYSITTDEAALISRVFDAIATAFPGWVANEAHLEVVLAEELTRLVAEARTVAADVPASIFDAFGSKIVGIQRILGARASARTTWTALNDTGYTVPAGTVVGYRAAGDTLWTFEVTSGATIAPGDTSVTDVEIRATDIGANRNGVVIGAAFELVDSLGWVDTITSTTASAGGIDAESDGGYLDRLAAELALMAPRPILPGDFAVLAKETEGVFRARAIDGYNPADDTSDNPRMVTVAAVDAAGAAVASGVQDAMQADLDARREVNFVVNVIDPEYTVVDVTFAAIAVDGFDPAIVQSLALEVLTSYLSSANWAGGSESPPTWRARDVVRHLKVAAVLESVEGLDYVSTLTMGKNGGAQSAANVTLDGIAPLPSPGAIVGTVT